MSVAVAVILSAFALAVVVLLWGALAGWVGPGEPPATRLDLRDELDRQEQQ